MCSSAISLLDYSRCRQAPQSMCIRARPAALSGLRRKRLRDERIVSGMAAPLANLVLRSAVWLGALVWWVSLRKPANMSWAGIPFGVVTVLGLVIMGAGMAIFIWT